MWRWQGQRSSVNCVVVMLSSSTESLSSISLFVYCASPTPPMMSHSQLLISNQCWVPDPLHPSFFPSLPPWASWIVDWFTQMNTPTLYFSSLMTKNKKKNVRHPFLGQVFASPQPPSLCFSSCHASRLWHAKLRVPSKADPTTQIFNLQVNGKL